MSMSRIPWVAQSIVLVAVIGLVLFGSAGRLDIPAFWVYLSFWLVASLVSIAVVDLTLYQERMRPGGRPIKAVYWLLMVPLILHLVVAGVDVGREHWSDSVPHPLQWLGMLLFAAGWTLTLWAMHVNRFFSSVVRIQQERGHQLVTTGPYAWVRHPGYVAGLLVIVSSGVALGSWFSVVPVVLMLPGLFIRTVKEDRFLKQNLPGYLDYSEKVRYRMLPGVW
jgi:protein-S-isoprenylcysteine O-methyltransferase Ste14